MKRVRRFKFAVVIISCLTILGLIQFQVWNHTVKQIQFEKEQLEHECQLIEHYEQIINNNLPEIESKFDLWKDTLNQLSNEVFQITFIRSDFDAQYSIRHNDVNYENEKIGIVYPCMWDALQKLNNLGFYCGEIRNYDSQYISFLVFQEECASISLLYCKDFDIVEEHILNNSSLLDDNWLIAWKVMLPVG